MREDERSGVLRLERRATAKHEVENGAERVHVGSRVGAQSHRHLGRHVRGRSEERSGVGHLAVAALDLGDAEIDHLHEVVLAAERREKQVLGLHVAVDDPVLVRLGERAGGLADDVNRSRRSERSEPVDVLREVSPSRSSIT